MSTFNFDSKFFEDHIKKFAHNYSKQSRIDIINAPKFRILKSNYLDKFWEKRVNKRDLYTIYIDLKDIEELDLLSLSGNLNSVIINELKTNNILRVNNRFEVIESKWYSPKTTTEAREYFSNLSLNGKCVCFFGQEGVDLFINGVNEIQTNIFYSMEDFKRYSEKYHISEINKVFEIYKNLLKEQYVYSYFFAEKATCNQVELKSSNSNIVKNKPEKLMRDHLRSFLNDRVQGTFLSENELSASKRKLDIHTEVDNQYYFFEIKWLGSSISDCGKKIVEPYPNVNDRARKGVKQTLEYIEELINVMKVNLKAGYLVIFDARQETSELDYKDMSFIEDELKKYLIYFDKFDSLILKNRHPA